MAHQHHITADRDRIPLAQKIAFGLGMAVPIAFVNSVAQMSNLIFNLGLGISVVWLGIAQMIPRFWDAISDPLAGYLSDNTRTRWGRRRPWMVIGGVLVAITYVLIWWVPDGWSKGGLFCYYLGISLLFYTAVTIYSVPLVALGYEMTNDYHEKTRLFAAGSFFGNVLAIATPWMYKIAMLDRFENEVEGMKIVSLYVGVIILVTTVWSGVVCKESTTRPAPKKEKVPFWASMKATLQNRTFLQLMLMVFAITAGFNFVANFSNYIVIFFVYAGDKAEASNMMAINGTVWALTALVAVFPMTWISTKMGKVFTIRWFVGLMAAGSFAKIVCYDPSNPWLMIIPTFMISAGMLVLYTMAGAMVADICSEDELESGIRREGSFSAVYGWWLKVAVSIGFLTSGFLLKSTGFDESVAIQTKETLFMLRFWEIALPGVLCALGVFMIRKYRLTEDRAYEVKELLEKRAEEEKAKAAEAAAETEAVVA